MLIPVIPAKAGIQNERGAVALDPRFRGDDDERNAATLAHERQPAKAVS
jgi:hypothetical protein